MLPEEKDEVSEGWRQRKMISGKDDVSERWRRKMAFATDAVRKGDVRKMTPERYAVREIRRPRKMSLQAVRKGDVRKNDAREI
jgi:hypothetical protein